MDEIEEAKLKANIFKFVKQSSSVFKYQDSGDGLDGYQISFELGQGSFGKVYLAMDKRTGASVAIKAITNLESGIEMLIREIGVMTQLNHSNVMKVIDIIPVYLKDSDKNDMGLEQLYIVLEYAQSDLRKLILSQVYLNDKQVKQMMYQLLWGVNHIHSGGVMHRDLKPENILVNDTLEVKISDFGLARSLDGITDWDVELKKYFEEDKKDGDSEDDIQTPKKFNMDKKHSKSNSNDEMNMEELTQQLNIEMRKKTSTVRKGSDDEYVKMGIHDEREEQKRIWRALKLSEKYRKKEPRELSPHVVTRYYRSPELCLKDKNYNCKIDIWSLGVIFLELLQMKKSNVSNYKHRKVMFRGESWLALSPPIKKGKRAKKKKTSYIQVSKLMGSQEIKLPEKDQLNVISKIMGSPKEKDLWFLPESTRNDYYRFYEEYEGKNLTYLFPGETDEWIHLLKKMLEFNPFLRYDISQCLEHPFFEDIRSKSKEVKCKTKVEFIKDERLTFMIHRYKLDKKKEISSNMVEDNPFMIDDDDDNDYISFSLFSITQ